MMTENDWKAYDQIRRVLDISEKQNSEVIKSIEEIKDLNEFYDYVKADIV